LNLVCRAGQLVGNSARFMYDIFLRLKIFFLLFAFSRTAPTAHGGSQARGRIGAVAAGLLQSNSNAGSKPHLRPTLQLAAMPDS